MQRWFRGTIATEVRWTPCRPDPYDHRAWLQVHGYEPFLVHLSS